MYVFLYYSWIIVCAWITCCDDKYERFRLFTHFLMLRDEDCYHEMSLIPFFSHPNSCSFDFNLHSKKEQGVRAKGEGRKERLGTASGVPKCS